MLLQQWLLKICLFIVFTQGLAWSILMGWQSGVVNWNDEENLSVATYMNYTRLFQQRPGARPSGAQTIRAAAGEV